METMIRPGQVWKDISGNRIQAHGANIYYEDGVYYWIGEDKSHTSKKRKIWTWGVRCYTSRDLVNWEDQGHIIEPVTDDRKSVFNPVRKLDRPHLLKNPETGKYVLWLKYCDKAHATVLTADKITGPYTLIHEELHPYGTKFGDFDIAADEKTGQGYLFFEADHDKVIGCRLNEEYTDVAGDAVHIFDHMKPPFAREGITHLIHKGKHYLLSSGMSGYVPNPSEAAVSDDWLGPYIVQGSPHVNDDSCASFNSQISDAFLIHGTDQWITAADRWVPYYKVTRERYESLKRAICMHSDPSVKASFKDMWTLLRSPIMGSADTSVADYV